MATGLHSVTSMIARAAAAALLWSLALGAAAQTVRYIHTDALGSVAVVTDQNRNVIERREYEPYGAQLTPAVKDGPGYTGHVQDAVTGLTYMQQRYYDPGIGMMLSTDPVTAYDSGDWRQFNRYAYVFNNPYKFTDPDGRCPMPGSSMCGKTMETIQVQDAAQYRGEDTVIAKVVIFGMDFTPIIGDRIAVGEAIRRPSPVNVAAAGIGLLGPVGDGVGKSLKHLDDFNQARNAALKWFENSGGGFKAETPTIGKFGGNAGNPIGMKTADGKAGFRVEFDERHGAHINVWSGRQKATFSFEGTQKMVDEIVKQFNK